MNTRTCSALLLPLSLATALSLQAAAPATLTIQTDQPGAKINPAMWGIFFEDINLGADGGLYAELIKNRSFEFPDAMMGWTKANLLSGAGVYSVVTERPFNESNPHYLRLESRSKSPFGVENGGFRGIGARAGETYDFSAQMRCSDGKATLYVELVDIKGKVLAAKSIQGISANWERRTTALRPNKTDPKTWLRLSVQAGNTVDLDMVSLFPRKTWKNRPGGLRADMVQLLADLKPGFLRFPGGCIVEGNFLTNRYQWKNTLGPAAERKLLINRWNFEFKHRPTPDYFQTFGLGFFEYFQLCEDLGAEPLPILNCGMACQFNSGELCPLDQLDPYIQDALDLIEFANGPATSTWGAKRAAMGHPQPFKMKLLGIGNEQWDQPYLERYAKFHAVLKRQHPGIQLISSAGPSPDDNHFKFAWPKLRELHADLVDEHCYANPKWFFANTHRYDTYDRLGPKVFFGEYAAQSDKTVSVLNRNNLECALAEAACMTGLERNADVVRMASYAPLFGHEEGWQWRPNLIWVDNLASFGTPNYYVQQLFARNRGDRVLPVALTSPGEDAGLPKVHASATLDELHREVILKFVNATTNALPVQIKLAGGKRFATQAQQWVLAAADQRDENTFAAPTKIAPRDSSLRILAPDFTHTFPPNSLTVLRVGKTH